jgi:hypothetical protein
MLEAPIQIYLSMLYLQMSLVYAGKGLGWW